MKAAFIGIDLFLPALEALEASGADIIKIFTCETDNVTEFNHKVIRFAKDRKIPLQIERIRRRDLEELAAAGCGFAVCAGYYHKIPVIPEFPIVNIHPSLLPEGRGPWPMPVTLLSGADRTGVTMHRMTEELDAGEILLQEKIPVFKNDDLKTLTGRQQEAAARMVKKLCKDEGSFRTLWDNAYPQTGPSSYWECPSKKEMTVRESMTALEADRICRAFFGYEVFYEGAAGFFELIGARVCPAAAEGCSLAEQEMLGVKGGYLHADRIRRIS